MNRKNTPKLRFKEFEKADPWEQRKFDEWGTFYYGHSCPKWSVTEDATTPCIRYGELYTKFGAKIDKVYSYTNIPPEKLRFSTGKEVLIPRVGEDPWDYNHCTWLSLKDVAIGEMISVFNTDQDPLFSATMFNATLQKEFAVRVEGGSVTNLYFEKLKNIDVSYPSLPEQKKIAAFFENIDNLITLHQRKYEKLKKVKNAYLDEMFPKNGERFPKRRFPGFTDPWEQRKLGELCERVTRKNKTGESDLPLTIASQYGLIDQRDFFNKVVAAKDMSNYYLLKKGEFAYNKSYSNGYDFGSIKRLNAYEQGCLSTLYICFGITSDDIESDYLECFFDTLKWYSDITMICAEGARNHGLLNVDTKAFFDEVTIEMPSSKGEQRKISSYLNNLDNLITLHR